METLNVVNELRAQLAQAEMDLSESKHCEQTDQYKLWMEQQTTLIQELKHEIELFA